MTTQVIITILSSNHEVKVGIEQDNSSIDAENHQWEATGEKCIVKANEAVCYYIYGGRRVVIEELPNIIEYIDKKV